MDLIKIRKNKTQLHLLCKDHIPNFAMKNEFQTITFSLKINRLEIHEDEYFGYVIEEGGAFLCIDLTIKNLTGEILSFSRSDFLISYDCDGPFDAEEYFGADNQFNDLLVIQPFESVNGKYVYTISKSAKKIAFKYYESYDDQHMKEYRLRYVISQ